MTASSAPDPRRLASELADLDAAARAARLAALDPASAEVVRGLLDLLESDTLAGDSQAAPDAAPPVDAAGARFGQFSLIRLLGEGGMGTVYLAEQDRPRRLVALKLIRHGQFSPDVLERFRREAEFLGQLEHPGIARVFEVGEQDTASGRVPYLAMEYIEGENLRRYCDKAGLDDRQRLAYVARVARAVHHAHVRGVVHRDLKPGNILVDAQGQPRVLDFGIALALDDANSEPQRLTRHGELVGTLSYMSPEQIAGDARRVDQRSDVYALGVILYELLSGEHPHALRDSSLIEAVRIVQEQPARALARGRPELAGDIDTIAMKALDPDRDRRYQSAAELADDIERHLDDRPILARPATTLYLAGKFLRRHRLGVSAAAIAVLSLIAAVAVSLYFALAEADARREAVARAEANQAVTRFLVDMLTSADPERALGEQLTLREALDRAAASADIALDAQPLVRAQIKGTLGSSYRSLGEFGPAEQLFRQAIDAAGSDADAALPHRLNLLGTLTDAGRYQEALDLHAGISPQLTALPAAHPLRLQGDLHHGTVLAQTGQQDAAMAVFHKVREVADAHPELDPELAIQARHNHASVMRLAGNLEESERMLRETLALRAQRYGPDHPLTLFSHNNLVGTLENMGKLDEAEGEIRHVLAARERVLGADHLSTLNSLQNRIVILVRMGRQAEAEPLARDLIERVQRVMGSRHARTLQARNTLAYILEDLDQPAEAERLYRDILSVYAALTERTGPQDAEMLGIHNNLAMLLSRRALHEEALREFEQLIATTREGAGEAHPYYAIFRSNQGDALNKAGRPAQAQAALEDALPRLVQVFGEDHSRVRDAARRLATAHDALGQHEEAQRYTAMADAPAAQD
ncbi:MAG: serine/threonine-protein kinase [Lysobacteraceae bacterium]